MDISVFLSIQGFNNNGLVLMLQIKYQIDVEPPLFVDKGSHQFLMLQTKYQIDVAVEPPLFVDKGSHQLMYNTFITAI